MNDIKRLVIYHIIESRCLLPYRANRTLHSDFSPHCSVSTIRSCKALPPRSPFSYHISIHAPVLFNDKAQYTNKMMASFMSYFGGRKDTKQAARDAIVGLRQQLQLLEKKEEHLQKKVDEEMKKARANAVSNKTGKYSPSPFELACVVFENFHADGRLWLGLFLHSSWDTLMLSRPCTFSCILDEPMTTLLTLRPAFNVSISLLPSSTPNPTISTHPNHYETLLHLTSLFPGVMHTYNSCNSSP